jgi:AcrR family transcriptional regulator
MAKAASSKSDIVPAPVPAPVEVLDRAVDAALKLAGEAPWRDLTLRDIASEAGVSFAELYARAPGKGALLDRLSQRFDRAALKEADDPSPDVGDRLFEAIMARLEVMEPDRIVLIAIAQGEGPSPRMAARLAATSRALLEAAERVLG